MAKWRPAPCRSGWWSIAPAPSFSRFDPKPTSVIHVLALAIALGQIIGYGWGRDRFPRWSDETTPVYFTSRRRRAGAVQRNASARGGYHERRSFWPTPLPSPSPQGGRERSGASRLYAVFAAFRPSRSSTCW